MTLISQLHLCIPQSWESRVPDSGVESYFIIGIFGISDHREDKISDLWGSKLSVAEDASPVTLSLNDEDESSHELFKVRARREQVVGIATFAFKPRCVAHRGQHVKLITSDLHVGGEWIATLLLAIMQPSLQKRWHVADSLADLGLRGKALEEGCKVHEDVTKHVHRAQERRLESLKRAESNL